MKRLLLTFLTLLSFYILYGNSNVMVIGTLTTRGIPCNSEECPTLSVFQITNDTASYVLKTGEQYVEDIGQLGSFSEGETVALRGVISEKEDNNGKYYELNISAILINVSDDRFAASCNGEVGEENNSTQPTVKIQNDSIIIEYVEYKQCCAKYALRTSDIINDTLFVILSDTAREECDCMCNFDIRISVIASTSENIKVCYNGIIYGINTSEIINQINISKINLFPNPNEGEITIKGVNDYENMRYEICNSIGQIIQFGNLERVVELSTIKNGLYFIKIIHGKNIL
ncbi:MAG: T9SS type A sorting domain-containing protein [Paludibacter sp.]|nr:T9SS type A sorting domain-containing protein [Paludibacter sp.]